MTETEIIKRKIFLKRQLIQVTKKEIKALTDDLKRTESRMEAKHDS